MTKRIRAVAFDAFDTLIVRHIRYKSPLKEFVANAYPFHSRDLEIKLSREAMSNRMTIHDIADEARCICGPHAASEQNIESGIEAAYEAMKLHMNPGTYRRSPSVETVLKTALQSNLQVGVVSDLAASFEPIVERELHDVQPHILSFDVGAIKESGEPFYTLADKLGCQLEEIAFVGDNLVSDYRTPKDLGMEAFLYVPNEHFASRNGNAMTTYKNDVITELPQVFTKLRQRGYTFG